MFCMMGLWSDLSSLFFSHTLDPVIRGNRHKLKHKRCHLNTRKHFFIVRVTEHWNRLSKEAVESPSLEIFKSCMDMVLGNML